MGAYEFVTLNLPARDPAVTPTGTTEADSSIGNALDSCSQSAEAACSAESKSYHTPDLPTTSPTLLRLRSARSTAARPVSIVLPCRAVSSLDQAIACDLDVGAVRGRLP